MSGCPREARAPGGAEGDLKARCVLLIANGTKIPKIRWQFTVAYLNLKSPTPPDLEPFRFARDWKRFGRVIFPSRRNLEEDGIDFLREQEMALFNERIAVEPTATVYHYAGQSACLGILESKKFWASHIEFLNDFSEYQHAISVSTEVLEELSQSADPILREFSSIATEKLKTLDEFPYFIVSFSQLGDSISQWRSYAGNGPGFSLGFDGWKLEKHAKDSEHLFGKCIYDRKEQESFIRQLVAIYTKDFITYFPFFGHGEINGDLCQTRAELVVESISSIAPFFKHPEFKEESEWRLIIKNRTLTPKFRPGTSGIIPYVEENIESLLQNGLKSVKTKPVRDPDFLERGLIFLLRAQGWQDPEKMIKRSGIPYRELP